LHASLALPGGLRGVLRPVIERAMLAMFHAREALALGGPIALEFIRDDDPRNVLTALEERAEERLGGPFVPSPLHQEVELHAVLIHGPPQRVPLLLDRDEDLIQMPLIPGPRPPAAQLIGILLPELPAPLADGFVGDDDTADEEEFFDVTMAEAKTVVQPNGVTDDFPRKAMMLVRIGCG
jgi:hypothetical protein